MNKAAEQERTAQALAKAGGKLEEENRLKSVIRKREDHQRHGTCVRYEA